MEKHKLQQLPPVDALLSEKGMEDLYQTYARSFVKNSCRQVLQDIRQHIEDYSDHNREEWTALIVKRVELDLANRYAPRMKPVINATGIILHTGLGRAPLSPAAQQNVASIIQGYSSLELDMASGKRGNRHLYAEYLIQQLTGAEAAVVVNNNAAAVFISLNTVAFGKEAIISRGQLVEIGGSFRIPDVIEKSGAVMVEVGTTNKTKLADYRRALSPNTGAIIVAHTSNYRVMGFTAEATISELKDLVKDRGIPIVHDLGGGVIVDLTEYGLPYEPLVQHSLRDGADIVTFSGDKILGGPQCGIIAGKKEWIARIAANPVMRAVRPDKMTFAALEATLRLFLQPERLAAEHPVMRMLTEPVENVRKRAQQVLDLLKDNAGDLDMDVQACEARTGSGALPLENIASMGIVISGKGAVEKLAALLRMAETPVVGYIKNDQLVLDMRTVMDDQVELLADMLRNAINRVQQ